MRRNIKHSSPLNKHDNHLRHLQALLISSSTSLTKYYYKAVKWPKYHELKTIILTGFNDDIP